MREKPTSTPKQNEIDAPVRLKPLMGMRPGVWLTVFYSFILLVLLVTWKHQGDRMAGAIVMVYVWLSGVRVFVMSIVEPAREVLLDDLCMALAGHLCDCCLVLVLWKSGCPVTAAFWLMTACIRVTSLDRESSSLI